MRDPASATCKPEQTALVLEYKHDRPLASCCWDPLSRFVFFGAEDHLVHRFDLSQRTVVSLAGHDSWVRALGCSPEGDFLYTGGYDGRLICWPAADDKPAPLRIIEAHQGWIRAMAVSHGGEYIASCGNDRLVKLWDASSGALIKAFRGHTSHVYHLVFTADSSAVVSCDHKGIVNLWTLDADAPREMVKVEALHSYDTTFRADIGGARAMTLSSEGAQVALGGITNVSNAFAGVGEIAVALVDLAEGKLVRLLESKEKTRGTIWGVAHHPAGFWVGLSGGGGGGWLHFWKGDTNHEFFRFQLKNDGRGLSMSPDRMQLAVAHADMHLRTYALNGAGS